LVNPKDLFLLLGISLFQHWKWNPETFQALGCPIENSGSSTIEIVSGGVKTVTPPEQGLPALPKPLS